MQPDQPSQVSALLARWATGDQQAVDELVPLVYSELHRLAHYRLRGEKANHTLQTSALVNEAYLRLCQKPRSIHDGKHFFALAAKVMRDVLVDYAREKKAQKRGGGAISIELEDVFLSTAQRGTDLIALDEALNKLAEMDQQQAKIVELRFFAGLSIEDTSEVLGVSPATIKREWATARAWLYRAISGKAANA